MYKIAKESPENLKALFTNTAIKKSISPAIIEKDFWVCLILDYLFNDCTYKDSFTFKGGTSLSKCFNLINRFSEDIDLILDWQVLGYSLNEPWEDRSKNKQNKFNEEANQKAVTFIANELLPCLEKDLDVEVRKNAMIALYNMSDRSILDEVINSPNYPDLLKMEAVAIIEEYENGDDEDYEDD